MAVVSYVNEMSCGLAISALDGQEFGGLKLKVEQAGKTDTVERGHGRGGFRGSGEFRGRVELRGQGDREFRGRGRGRGENPGRGNEDFVPRGEDRDLKRSNDEAEALKLKL